eukprot:5120416-Amphidinium_carterae.1
MQRPQVARRSKLQTPNCWEGEAEFQMMSCQEFLDLLEEDHLTRLRWRDMSKLFRERHSDVQLQGVEQRRKSGVFVNSSIV